MGARTRAATAAVAVTALAVATATAVGAVPLDLPAVGREFTPADLPGTFTSAFKNDDACPSSVDFGAGSLNDRGVYEVPWANIRENGSPCAGSGSMRFFSKAVALDPARLAQAGFPDLQNVINSSAPARTTLFSGLSQRGALIGWDGGAPRTCGSTTYPADTFYFFISEDSTVDITINKKKDNDQPHPAGHVCGKQRPRLVRSAVAQAGGHLDAASVADDGDHAPAGTDCGAKHRPAISSGHCAACGGGGW